MGLKIYGEGQNVLSGSGHDGTTLETQWALSGSISSNEIARFPVMSGSLTTLFDAAGSGLIRAGSNITITSGSAASSGGYGISNEQNFITIAASGGGGGSMTWVLEDDDGTEVTIADDNEVKFIGAGITTNWTDVTPGSDGDPFDMTFTVDAAQTGITSVKNNSLVIGGNTQNNTIDFGTDDVILFDIDNTEVMRVDAAGVDIVGALTLTTDLAVAQGGTGVSTLTDGGILLGSGAGAITAMAVLADGEIVIGDGSTDPIAYAAFSASDGTLKVTHGGTGAATLTDGGVLLGSGTGAVTAMAVLADGEMIVGDGTTDPVAESGATLRTSIGVGTGDSPQFTAVNIGAASDTTLSRPSAGDLQIESNIIYRAGGTDVPVADGGTGVSTLTDGGVLLGSGAGAITAMAVLADGEMIVGDGTTDPVAESGATLRTSIGVGTGDTLTITSLVISAQAASLAMNSQKITGLSDPASAQDAATKAYVDALGGTGLDIKASCVMATTADLNYTYSNGSSGVGATLTASGNGAVTIDGIATATTTQRVLVKNQDDAEENGIYTVTTASGVSATLVLTRAVDADTAAELTSGAFTFVEQGTVNADNGYVMTQDATITMGTTDLTWVQFSGAGQIVAGVGLSKSNNTLTVDFSELSAKGANAVAADSLCIVDSADSNASKKLTVTNLVGLMDGTGLTATAGVLAVDASQTQITSVGTIGTGVWEGTDVGVAHGGTGVSTLTDGGVLLGSGAGAITAMAVLADGEFIVGDGTTDPVAESGATLRTSIGVGTGDSPQFTAVNLGGNASITDSSPGLTILSSEDVLVKTTSTADDALVLQSAGALLGIVGANEAVAFAISGSNTGTPGDSQYYNEGGSTQHFLKCSSQSGQDMITLGSGWGFAFGVGVGIGDMYPQNGVKFQVSGSRGLTTPMSGAAWHSHPTGQYGALPVTVHHGHLMHSGSLFHNHTLLTNGPALVTPSFDGYEKVALAEGAAPANVHATLLKFDKTDHVGVHIAYAVRRKTGSTGGAETGTIFMTSNGSAVSCSVTANVSVDPLVTFSAAVSGDYYYLQYQLTDITGTQPAAMRFNVERIIAFGDGDF